jgi:hypothetical protein
MKMRNSSGYLTPAGGWIIGLSITVGVLILVAALMTIIPSYRVWSQEMRGKAALAEAEQDRKILIEEAKAKVEADSLNAISEVFRAKGMAEAMVIENGQLTEVYNQYLFIRTLEELAKHGDLPQIIYLPASGMIPVMDLNKQHRFD